MNYFSNVKIPVFGVDADAATWTNIPAPLTTGVYFSDDDWLRTTNTTRTNGVVEGIARSVDYNTVMRQCSVMASLFANILAYRNSLTKTGVAPYGGAANSPIGTTLLSGETSMDNHIGALSEIFAADKFLADSEVTTRTIATGAVTTAKLADSTGTSDGVTTSKIATDAITKSKLGNGLVSVGSSSANGITVTLNQATTSGARGFQIGVSSSKVSYSSNSDYAYNAHLLKTAPTTSTKIYLCGVTSTEGGDTFKNVYNHNSVYMASGGVTANSFNATSDLRLKENIVDVGKHQVRALVEGANIKTFSYKDDPNHTTHVGMIAQDLLNSGTVIGDLLVSKDSETDMLSIKESKLVYILWDYVKQQSERIAELEKLLKSRG